MFLIKQVMSRQFEKLQKSFCLVKLPSAKTCDGPFSQRVTFLALSVSAPLFFFNFFFKG